MYRKIYKYMYTDDSYIRIKSSIIHSNICTCTYICGRCTRLNYIFTHNDGFIITSIRSI